MCRVFNLPSLIAAAITKVLFTQTFISVKELPDLLTCLEIVVSIFAFILEYFSAKKKDCDIDTSPIVNPPQTMSELMVNIITKIHQNKPTKTLTHLLKTLSDVAKKFVVTDGTSRNIYITVFNSDKLGKDKSLEKLNLDINDIFLMD